MRVFVTGATGFIGGHLCARLAAHGHHVIALLRTPAKAALLPAGTEIVAGDLGLFQDPATVLPQADVVVHLAGVVTARTLHAYQAINRDAVQHLVDCIGRQSWTPRRLLFASSLAAAGPSPADRPWTEADAPQPIEPYGRAKAQAEALLRDAPFDVTVFRPPLVFGPRDPATLPLYQAARRRVGMRVAGPPQRLSYVDVRDAVSGIVAMASDTRSGHFTYFLSHPDPSDLVQLWAALGSAVSRSVWVVPIPAPLLYVAMRAATLVSGWFGVHNALDAKQYQQMIEPAFVCDSAALRRDLSWAPQHGLTDAVAHAAQGYRSAGSLKG
jgi:UDP-glucose 4-epimerase